MATCVCGNSQDKVRLETQAPKKEGFCFCPFYTCHSVCVRHAIDLYGLYSLRQFCQARLGRLDNRADRLTGNLIRRADLLVGHAARAQAREMFAPRGFPDGGQVLERHLV